MPIFMDLHKVSGITAKDAAGAHCEDLKIQEQYGCNCMTYWVDEERESAFCLIEAPSKEAVKEMHDKAHGLIPHEIIEVDSNIVKAFLGRIQDPDLIADLTNPHFKVFNDSPFRILLLIKTIDSRLLQNSLGNTDANAVLSFYNKIISEELKRCEGCEVELEMDAYVASFSSVKNAVNCALAIKNAMQNYGNTLNLKIVLHAGTPMGNSDVIFGETLKMAKYLFQVEANNQIIISPVVKNVIAENRDQFQEKIKEIKSVTPSEEKMLSQLMHTLEQNWQNPLFSSTQFCEVVAMSKSNLYRKCLSLTGQTPNALLRNYRLMESLKLLKSDRGISQIVFDSGFNSPSYFTKCFHKQFGLRPNTFQNPQA